MRLTTFFLLIALLHASASSLAQQVTLHEKQASMQKVLSDIEKQSGYNVFYGDQVLQNIPLVDIDLNNVPLEDALIACFKGQPLSFKIIQQTIVVKRKDEIPVEKPTVPLPPHDIIGRVTNAAGQPLDGATVIIKRKQSGVLTNANGLFRLAEVYPTDTLYVSYIGYARAIVRVGSETNLKIVLKEATNSLDQVVVQAYGETSQRTATGNIGTVTAAQIAKEPVMNVLNVLQGQIPGVLVTNTSGYSSGTINVQIRGRNTVGNFPADPLYVIDGVPLTILEVAGQYGYNSGSMGTIQSGIQSPAVGQSPFFNINPGDIESISVLKDADATAIYGSRGANGVILITTKKGKAGKTHVEVNGYDGISEDNRYYQLLTTSQYIEMRKEALANDGLPININTAPDLVAWSPNSDTNWQKVLFGGFGKTADASVSLSGGDSNNTFRISTTYHNQTDILTYSGANQRGSFSFNFNHKSTDQRFNLALTTNYTLTSVNTIEVPLAISLPPNAPPIFNSQGNLNYAGWAPLNYAFPFSSLLNPYTAATNLLNSNLVLSYELTKGLILKTSLGYNNIESSQTQVTTIASQDPSTDPTGSSSIGNTLIHNLIVEPDIEYNRYINKGKFDVLLGATAQENTTIGSNSNGYGYTNDALLTAIGAAPTQSANNYKALYGYEGVFGRINYNWENKYIIDLNGRRDGSTKFAPGLQFGNFGSVGTAWIFSEENWIKQNIQSLSFGKIRASYGTTGGDQIGNYQYLSRWSFSQFTYNGTSTLNPVGHSDSTIHWQVNKKAEITLNLGFLKDRITIDATWYRDRTSDQLVEFPTPAFTGFTQVTSNSPATVQNMGWEFSVNGKIIDNKDFKWAMRFNIGINRNKLISYPDLSQSPYANTYIIGQPLNIQRVLHVTGVDPLTGLYTFEDKNKDGQITIDYTGQNDDDRYVVDLDPKFDGGISSNFSYRNWELDVFFYFRKQIGNNYLSGLQAPGGIMNQPAEVLNAWQYPGDITNTARYTTEPYNNISYNNYYYSSDAAYSDASFIRLQNLSISYNLPDLFKKFGLLNSRVYLQGQNIFVLTKYRGLDPETQNFNGLPTPRTLTAGLSCNF